MGENKMNVIEQINSKIHEYMKYHVHFDLPKYIFLSPEAHLLLKRDCPPWDITLDFSGTDIVDFYKGIPIEVVNKHGFFVSVGN
jgi:hypothetical protein